MPNAPAAIIERLQEKVMYLGNKSGDLALECGNLRAQLATARADGRKQGLKIGEEFAMEYTSEKYATETVKDVAFAIANSISMIAAHGLPEDDKDTP